MTILLTNPTCLPSLRIFSSSATRALSNNIHYRVASEGLTSQDDTPHLLGFNSLKPEELVEIQKYESDFVSEIKPHINDIKEYLNFLRDSLEDIDNSRGIKTIVRENILNGMSEKAKKHAEDFFFLLGIESKKNPYLGLDSDLALLISQTISDLRKEYRVSHLGISVKQND